MTTSEAASASTTITRTLGGIQHVGLTVTDVESSCEWYQRVLGLQRQFQEPITAATAAATPWYSAPPTCR